MSGYHRQQEVIERKTDPKYAKTTKFPQIYHD